MSAFNERSLVIAKTLLSLALSQTFVVNANAQINAPSHTAEETGGSFSFVIENDMFGRESLDRDYTSGFEFGWTTGRNRSPGWTEFVENALTSEGALTDTRATYALGHQIYTPEDISLVVPNPTDRPYAGLLYGAIGVLVNENDNRFDQIQLTLGVVGPASLADELQIWYHDIIQGIEPRGWDSQISNRPAFQLAWRRTHLRDIARAENGFGAQIAPFYGARVGNLNTDAHLGVNVRIGFHLPVDFTPAQLQPSLPGAGYFRPATSFGWYVFGGVDGRYVARNLVLDEPNALGFSVEKEEWMGDAKVGAAFYIDHVRFAYTHTFRTREFETQNRDGSEFGALSITVNF